MEPTDSEIEEIVESTWASFLDLGVRRMAGGGEVGTDGLVGRVSIGGAWEGEVLFACGEELGRAAAATFFGLDPGAVVADEIRDAVAELTNVLGGNLKCLLPSGCRLSLPSVEDHAPAADGEPGTRGQHRVGFLCGERPFWVTLARRA